MHDPDMNTQPDFISAQHRGRACGCTTVYHRGNTVGSITRRLGADGRVTINGKRLRVEEPGGHCYVTVDALPRDLDTWGCG